MDSDPGYDEQNVELARAELLRRRLRVALRSARVDAKVTQGAVAEALDWSLSKVVRIEQGTVPVRPTDARAMLNLYRSRKPEEIESLIQLAREAREAKSFSEYDNVTSSTFKELVAQEQGANDIWKYEPTVVPGYFQTQDYSRHLLQAIGRASSEIDKIVELRSLRQSILDLPGGPVLNVILGEAALVRPIGGAEVMRDQIALLIELSSQERVHLQLMPFAAGAHPGLGEPFTVLQFDDPYLEDSLYLEDAGKRVTARDDADSVERYLHLFNQLHEMSTAHGNFGEQVQRIMVDRYPPES